MTAHRFTQSEIHYLKMLPAVRDVTSSRISYSDEFRESATRRYLAGESPVEIFREAGLDPRLIGYKRIERAFARWRGSATEIPRRGRTDSFALFAATPSARLDHSDRQRQSTAAGTSAEPSSSTASPAASSAPFPESSEDSDSEDPRDRLIAKQALRIAELERQRDQLLEQLKALY